MTMKLEGDAVRSLRERRGWSQQQLAEVAGLSVRTVQRLETAGIAAGETRMAVAAALDVAPQDLLAAPVAAQTVSRPGPGLDQTLKLIWTALAVLGFLLVAGYQVGKDAALRDNRMSEAATAGPVTDPR